MTNAIKIRRLFAMRKSLLDGFRVSSLTIPTILRGVAAPKVLPFGFITLITLALYPKTP
jgi:hypothetical protein